MTSHRHSVICACLLVWNILLPVCWFLQAEAIAVNRASAKYEGMATDDNAEYVRLMREEVDATRQRGGHYFYALAILAAVNAAGIGVLAFWRANPRQPATN